MLRNTVRPAYKGLMAMLPDHWNFRIGYWRRTGKIVWLKHPRTFNEKVHHRKFFDHDPRMPALMDKYLVKAHVAKLLGEDWVIPTLYYGKKLPRLAERNWPIPYVIKPSHASQTVIFIKSETDIDWRSIQARCARWVASTYAPESYEWAYLHIEPGIIVEPFMGGSVSPTDYKFFVFEGRVHYIQVDRDRHSDHKQSFYDRSWQRQPFRSIYTADPVDVPAPASLDRMITAAECLGRDWSFVRVDLYELDDGPKFGEMTFYPNSGLGLFDPPEYDRMLGDLWPLRRTSRLARSADV